jgi:hypothetical protein
MWTVLPLFEVLQRAVHCAAGFKSENLPSERLCLVFALTPSLGLVCSSYNAADELQLTNA